MQPKQIAIYSRKSKYTAKGESMGNQAAMCRGYIGSYFGTEAAQTAVLFEDEGFSGGNLQRPGFRNMMEQLRSGRFCAVVVYRLDRISRNINDFAGLMEELKALGVTFLSIREQFDTSTPMGRAMMYIISVFSQLERETIAQRIRDNLYELAKTGRWLGGTTPTGFRSERQQLVLQDGKERRLCSLRPVEDEEQTVKLIFALYDRERSLSAVEENLRQQGLCSKNGRKFTRFSIRGILSNPVYGQADEKMYDYFFQKGAVLCGQRECFDGSCGIMPYGRTAQEKGKSTKLLPVSQWIIAVGKHPYLISSAQWLRVQEALEKQAGKNRSRTGERRGLLTGLLYCSCGSRMYPKKSGGNGQESTFFYVCKNKERSKKRLCACENIRGDALDKMIWAQMAGFFPNREQLAGALLAQRPRFLAQQQQCEKELREQKARLRECTEKIDAYLEESIREANPAVKKNLHRRIGELEAQRQALTEQLSLTEMEETGFFPEKLWQRLGAGQPAAARLSQEEKIAVLGQCFTRLTWNGRELTAEVRL